MSHRLSQDVVGEAVVQRLCSLPKNHYEKSIALVVRNDEIVALMDQNDATDVSRVRTLKNRSAYHVTSSHA